MVVIAGGFSYAETGTTAVEVPVETLDGVVERSGVGRIDLIKIDVEGSETAVIKGAAHTLERFRPVILVEAFQPSLSRMGSSVRELLDLIRGHGYEVEEFGAGGSPRPLADGDPQSLNVICRPVKRD